MFPIRGFPGFWRVGPIRPVRAIDDPWQDGDHVSSDDDKEELGGASVLIWRGGAARSPRRERPPEMVAQVAKLRVAARAPGRSTLSRAETAGHAVRPATVEAWELALEMKAPRSSRSDGA